MTGDEPYKSTITCKKCHDKRAERLGWKITEALETLYGDDFDDIYKKKKDLVL